MHELDILQEKVCSATFEVHCYKYNYIIYFVFVIQIFLFFNFQIIKTY